jgi:hypothetical protein
MTRPWLDHRRLPLLFAFGAVVITLFDAFHTLSGTTAYVGLHQSARLEWWTPLVFGAGTTVGGSVFAGLYRALGGTKDPPPWRVLASALWCFGALYFFSGFFRGSNATKLVVLALAATAAFVWLDRTWQGAVCAMVLTIIGPSLEIILVRVGTFVHLQPDFLGIPMWLPALYLCSAPVMGHGSRKLLAPRDTTARDAEDGARSSALPELNLTNH